MQLNPDPEASQEKNQLQNPYINHNFRLFIAFFVTNGNYNMDYTHLCFHYFKNLLLCDKYTSSEDKPDQRNTKNIELL